MIDYEVYKVVHIISIIIFVAAMSISLYGGNTTARKIATGVATLFILVGGMGLMARLGIKHKGPYPNWIIIKFFCWLVLAILTPILVKRAQAFRFVVLTIVIGIIGIAAYTAIYKIGNLSGF